MTSALTSANATIERRILRTCGKTFCPGDDVMTNPNFRRPSDETIVLMTCIFVGAIAASVILVAVGVDALSR
jgi:hypothetical protein